MMFGNASDIFADYTNAPIPQLYASDLTSAPVLDDPSSYLGGSVFSTADNSGASVFDQMGGFGASLINFSNSVIDMGQNVASIKNRAQIAQIQQETTQRQLALAQARANTTYQQQLRNVTGVRTLGGASPNQVFILLAIAVGVFVIAHNA